MAGRARSVVLTAVARRAFVAQKGAVALRRKKLP
jgi:hypothetical protein